MSRISVPFTVQDHLGNALDGNLHVYQHGTLVVANAYSAEVGGSPLTQPIAFTGGHPGIWVEPGDYDVTFVTGSGSFTQPFRCDFATSVGAPNVQTVNYTLVLADAGKAVEINSASPLTVTIPTNASAPFAVGTIIEITRMGSGTVTIAAAGGVTIRSRSSLVTIGDQYASVSLRQRATDEWVLVGDLA